MAAEVPIQDLKVSKELREIEEYIKLSYILECYRLFLTVPFSNDYANFYKDEFEFVSKFSVFYELRIGDAIGASLLDINKWSLEDLQKILDPKGEMNKDIVIVKLREGEGEEMTIAIVIARLRERAEKDATLIINDTSMLTRSIYNMRQKMCVEMETRLFGVFNRFIEKHVTFVYQNRSKFSIPDWFFKKDAQNDVSAEKQKVEFDKFLTCYQASFKEGISRLALPEDAKKCLLFLAESRLKNGFIKNEVTRLFKNGFKDPAYCRSLLIEVNGLESSDIKEISDKSTQKAPRFAPPSLEVRLLAKRWLADLSPATSPTKQIPASELKDNASKQSPAQSTKPLILNAKQAPHRKKNNRNNRPTLTKSRKP